MHSLFFFSPTAIKAFFIERIREEMKCCLSPYYFKILISLVFLFLRIKFEYHYYYTFSMNPRPEAASLAKINRGFEPLSQPQRTSLLRRHPMEKNSDLTIDEFLKIKE